MTSDWAPLLAPGGAALLGSTTRSPPPFDEAFTVGALFTPAECTALVAASEAVGYGTTDYPKEYRGNLRLTTVDPGLAAATWARLRPTVPATLLDQRGAVWDAVGLNECWRLAKYSPGDRFGAHVDAVFQRNDDECSAFTVNVYLNGGFKGGATRFYADKSTGAGAGGGETAHDSDSGDEGGGAAAWRVAPEAGLALVFRQPSSVLKGQRHLHDGQRLRSGHKYLLRSDVMYRRRRQGAGESPDGADVAARGAASTVPKNNYDWCREHGLFLLQDELLTLQRSATSGHVLVVDTRDDDVIGGMIPGALHMADGTFLAASLLPLLRRVEKALAKTTEKGETEEKVEDGGDVHVVFHCMESAQRGPRCARRFHNALRAWGGRVDPARVHVRVLRGGFDRWVRRFFHEDRSQLIGYDDAYWGFEPTEGKAEGAGGDVNDADHPAHALYERPADQPATSWSAAGGSVGGGGK